ncbi:hypothetical protein KEM56_004594 [Ascosphaera pollenicola]|nr:hypothetical protein KEM56_004594 [Ascosphaera pollenicola]
MPRSKTTSTSTPTRNSIHSFSRGTAEGRHLSGLTDHGAFNAASPSLSRSSSSARLDSPSTVATALDDDDAAARSKRIESTVDMMNSPKEGAKKESKGNVLVSVRVRPDGKSEATGRSEVDWYVDGRQSVVAYRGKDGGTYYYDNVFATNDDNARVYDASAKRLVRRVMEGYHGTVFAYGMTGTGKTFSMQGTASSPGVIPLAITDIFSYIRETPHREFLLRVSYLEIYNEKIHDLLAPPPTGNGLGMQPQQEEIKLREDSKRGVYATPLKEEIVQSPTQLLRVIARGDQNRRVGSTQYNARSSRSHAVVQIVVESRERAGTSDPVQGRPSGGVRVSTLSLIDLAGSERAAETKERRTEGAHINKSLLTLGTVISRLSENKDKNGNPTDRDGKHLPYRDSKLTRLLQPALSGNSLVSILCTIQIGYNGASGGGAGPANTHILETLNTLKFASRAKNNIVSNARKAEETLGQGGGDAGSRALLERYRLEISSLKAQLDAQAKAFYERESQLDQLEERLRARETERETSTRHEEQLLEMQLARTALKERIEHLNRLILSSKSNGVNMKSSFERFPDPMPESPSRSGRSSASTLGASKRPVSMLSLGAAAIPNNNRSSLPPEDEDDTIGEYADGSASLQLQVHALHADLADKNRYIKTLERRLLQARRSSQSRMSANYSHKKSNSTTDEPDANMLLHEKDLEILELRLQLDDKDRMVAALRSAARQRDAAFQAVSEPFIGGDGKRRSTASYGGTTVGPISPVSYISSASAPAKRFERDSDPKRHSVDTVSRMLDEMIEDRVDNVRLPPLPPPPDEEERKRSSSTGRHSTRNSTGGRAADRASNPPSSTAIPISSILRKPPARKSMGGPSDLDSSIIRPAKSWSRKSITSDSDNGFLLRGAPPKPPLDTNGQFTMSDVRPSPLLIGQRSFTTDTGESTA